MTLVAVLHEMPHDLYLLCLRNAFIERLESSEDGRNYLKDAVRLTQTEPDFAKIRAQSGYTAEVVVT